MKFNRKGKTVFAIALTACMAGMAFSALPLLSVHAVEENLKHCANGTCDENGYNAQGPCTTYTYAATEKTTWDELQKAAEEIKCTGWVFDGWYTKELEYKYWGDKEEVFACYDTGILFPKQDWKCALEFAEAYSDSKTVSETETESNVNYFKDLFGRWLTRFKNGEEEIAEQCEKDDECIIKETKSKIEEYKVTEQNVTDKVKESVTLYARMKPQVVQIKFLSKKPDSQKAKEDLNRPGVHYADVSQYIRIYRQYGTPLGEIFKDIGDVQFGRTLTGWRAEGQEEELTKEDGLWMATSSAYVKYWWCPKALKEDFVDSTPGKSDYKTEYDWSLNLYAVYEDEKDVEAEASQEQEAKKKALQAAQQKDAPETETDDKVEEKHTCGNGTLSFKEATCQETGIKAHFHCSCGKGYWDQNCTQPIDEDEDLTTPTHHNLVKISGKKPTCTEAGTADRWVCTTCHDTFADEKGEKKLDDYNVQALGHDYGNETNGNKVCTRCGDVVVSEKKAEPEVKPQDQPQVQPQAQEQPKVEEEKKEAPKTETEQEAKKEVKKEEVKKETKPAPKQETTAPQTPVAPEKDEEEEKDEVVIEREQQTRPSSRRSARA